MTNVTTDTKKISQKERSALRAAVRLKMKVLRTEVAYREAELLAGVESELARRFVEDRTTRDAFECELRDLTAECNLQLTALKGKYGNLLNGGRYTVSDYSRPYVTRRQDDREQLRRALIRQAQLKTRQATRQLDQQEADLLMRLATDALETDEARAFLGQIPTLAALLPGDVNELEATMT